MRFTAIAHEQLAQIIRPGDMAIDATVGNGHDTRFLAEKVGPSGHVFGFDIQDEALQQTASRLTRHQLLDRVTLIAAGHEQMRMRLPAKLAKSVAAITFNLGYLPGGNKHLATQASTSLSALKQSMDLLRPHGVISLLVYVGHPGGSAELHAVRRWLETMRTCVTEWRAETERSPVLLLIRRSPSCQ